jgi:hypothetical protein
VEPMHRSYPGPFFQPSEHLTLPAQVTQNAKDSPTTTYDAVGQAL